MVLILLLFQVALEYEYWNQEKKFLMNEKELPSRVDTNVLYSLYAFEFMILTSVFTARHIQGRSFTNGSKAIKESEENANEEIKNRRSAMLEGGAI